MLFLIRRTINTSGTGIAWLSGQGCSRMCKHLGRGHDKNAVFRGNHGMCRGVGDHIRQRGLAIPRFSVQAERYQSAAMKKACYYLRIRVPPAKARKPDLQQLSPSPSVTFVLSQRLDDPHKIFVIEHLAGEAVHDGADKHHSRRKRWGHEVVGAARPCAMQAAEPHVGVVHQLQKHLPWHPLPGLEASTNPPILPAFLIIQLLLFAAHPLTAGAGQRQL
mmetsp:Transcript_24876/g.47086  ORF Transcript_24876/g.47086 Transcript_24876/m.47086 type:complete len:219 (-) Transcript_24876:2-658(-)